MEILPISALVAGILILIVSADKFVEGAAATARRFGMAPLLIGIVIIGFGSSAPEMVISALSAMNGNPGIAVGNALGSNIANIALILGVTALLSPIAVKSSIVVTELPALALLTAAAGVLLLTDGNLSRFDGIVLIVSFLIIMGWLVYNALQSSDDEIATILETELTETMSLPKAVTMLVLGLVFLVISSRMMVWGGVEVAEALGISDLIIGLTIVAVGTSLPELASSIAAVRKNEHELALGNVIGSNMFNISIVLGIAGTIAPTTLDRDVLTRDFPFMGLLTLILFLVTYWFRGPGTGRINRFEGGFLLLGYVGYTLVLVMMAMSQSAQAS